MKDEQTHAPCVSHLPTFKHDFGKCTVDVLGDLPKEYGRTWCHWNSGMCIWASLYSWSYTLVALFFTSWLCQITIDGTLEVRHLNIWQCVKPCTPVVHIKIAGKWMFIPLKMVLICINRYWSIPISDGVWHHFLSHNPRYGCLNTVVTPFHPMVYHSVPWWTCSNGSCKQRLAQHLLKSQFFRIKTLSLMNQLIKPALARPYRGKTDVHIQGWPVQKRGRKVPRFPTPKTHHRPRSRPKVCQGFDRPPSWSKSGQWKVMDVAGGLMSLFWKIQPKFWDRSIDQSDVKGKSTANYSFWKVFGRLILKIKGLSTVRHLWRGRF